MNPLVTIFTITRNRSDLLPRAMKSILGQSYTNIEYIIIDSASTDNTYEVVKSFTDNRIRYIRLDSNETFGHCINLAVKLANGKYVTELDDDDEYCHDKIEKQVRLFESLSEDYGMVYCWMTYFDNLTGEELKVHKTELRGSVVDEVVEKPTVSGTPTLLFRKDIFEIIGGYKESDEIGIESDWEFAARICKHYKVDYVPESLVNVYVNHGHLRMSNKGYYQREELENIKFRNYFLKEFKDVFDRYPGKSYPHLYSLAYSLLYTGQYGSFLKVYRQLFKVSQNKFIVTLLPLRSIKNRLFHK